MTAATAVISARNYGARINYLDKALAKKDAPMAVTDK